MAEPDQPRQWAYSGEEKLDGEKLTQEEFLNALRDGKSITNIRPSLITPETYRIMADKGGYVMRAYPIIEKKNNKSKISHRTLNYLFGFITGVCATTMTFLMLKKK